MMFHGGMAGWAMLTWMVLQLAVVAAIIAGAVLLVRALSSRGGGWRGHDGALELLKERFARGEIDRDEFEERRRVLATDR